MGNRRHFAAVVALTIVVAGTSWRRAIEAAPAAHPLVAPESLADTGLYADGRVGVIATGNRAFSPQYPLWTDGATKRRWIRLPPGTRIDATDVNEWDMPVGTKVWKEFAFAGRAVETRFIWRASAAEWVFASYAWNAEGTEARLVPADGAPRVAEVAPNRFHSIPAVDQCRACHVSDRPQLLGVNALQLSDDRDPRAPHAEALEPGMLTLRTLIEQDLLTPDRSALVAEPPRIPARTPDERALLGYLAGNCGACHNRKSDLAPLGLLWKHSDMTTMGADALVGLVAKRTKWQVPGVPDGESVAIDPRHPEQSAILRRMRSRGPASQMPPIGTVVADRESVELLTRWLASQGALPSGEHER